MNIGDKVDYKEGTVKYQGEVIAVDTEDSNKYWISVRALGKTVCSTDIEEEEE